MRQLQLEIGYPIDTAPWDFDEEVERWKTSTENLIQVVQLGIAPLTIGEQANPSIYDNLVSVQAPPM